MAGAETASHARGAQKARGGEVDFHLVAPISLIPLVLQHRP